MPVGKVTACYTRDKLEDLYPLLTETYWSFKERHTRTGPFMSVFENMMANYNIATTSQIGKIHVQDIRSVLENDRVRINNAKDEKWRPKEVEEIVARANAVLYGVYSAPYNLLTNNCQHFANSCRYGKSRSQQVPDLLLKTGGTVASVVIPIVARNVGLAAVLPAVGIAATGPVGLAITGVAIGVGVVGAAIPPVVHAVQCLKKNS
uniref:LRAT domain-containing protein n=1 Tax=Strigamia maritima TaxID=126957 RepID=T1IPG3_STRMM